MYLFLDKIVVAPLHLQYLKDFVYNFSNRTLGLMLLKILIVFVYQVVKIVVVVAVVVVVMVMVSTLKITKSIH
uniref:NADH dehydrogenase subunit 6 n=1 Tax=Acrobeloides nanus TaxID=290746 RepID=A0A914CMA5_9BILA